MTDNGDELLALAARVEALTGPDYATGRLVLVATGRQRVECLSEPTYQEDPTHSLDAAMRLVPESYGFMVDGFRDHWWASLSEEEGFNAKAATPALALTAAALRALAHQQKDQTGS